MGFASSVCGDMRQDLVNQRFGNLLVLGDSGERKQRAIVWRCACDCGSEALVKSQLLTRGITRSCGCLQREQASQRRIIDHTGKKFGKLTVLAMESAGKGYGAAYAHWRCLCECGTEKIVRSNHLVNGDVSSCGCWRDIDLAGRRFGKLIATEKADRSRSGTQRWRCVCDCGGWRNAGANDLKSGKVISCGCAAYDPEIYMPASARMYGAAAVAKRRARAVEAGGSFTAEQITDLYLKQRGKCANCGVKLGDVFHRDHRVALSKGGTNDIGNIELLCGPCNLRKHAKDPIAWASENGRLL